VTRKLPAELVLSRPDPSELLEVVNRLAGEVYLEMADSELAELFIGSLARVFPGRGFAVRIFDPRSLEPARVYANWKLRDNVENERIRLKESSLTKTRLKRAVAASSRLTFGGRWDSPFPGVAVGFAVPLVASGELYGVLDVGYPLGADLCEDDEPLILPIANQVSVALRNERLHRETTLLRDYQAKLIEHANALILGVDRGWRITVCNQALLRLTGYSRGEVIGMDLRDWLPPDERPRLQKMFLQALSGAKSDTVEVTLMTADGSRVRTVWSVAAISGKHHEVEAVVAIGQDQTQLLELQSQIIQAEKLATLGQLAAGVVHELNNPLTSITVYAEYLLRKAERAAADDEPAVPEEADIEKLRRITGGAQRILQFARDLVQYAAPAGNELDMVSLNSVIEQSLSFCEHLFERNSIALEVDLAGDLPPLYAVPGQLEQVVINLVTNAVQAISGGGTVTVKSFPADAAEVGFSVEDTGTGIAPEEIDRIFEPFFTTKTDGRGTGLGLSIVTNIVEQHRGNIQVSAGEAGGAIFTVTLPATG
jgi:PAS domain S-box-containing protein